MIIVLRLLHILSGAFWYGAVMFSVRFLMPSLRAAGPAAGPVMAQLNQRRMPLAMMGAAIVNVVSGIWLMLIVSAGTPGVWMQSRMGQTFALGGTFTILALIVGMIVSSPAAKKLAAIGAAAAKRGGPPPPEEVAEIARLQRRLGVATITVATLLTLAVSAMAVARYL